MKVEPKNAPSKNVGLGKGIYTLAQSETPLLIKPGKTRLKIVKGRGSDLSDSDRLQNWARRKWITQVLVLNLIRVAERYGDTKFVKKCWNTWHCLEHITISGGRLYSSKYCKNRMCEICCGIRKAKIIHGYKPTIEKWKNPKFLTLTTRTVPARKLEHRVNAMYRAFKIIITRNKYLYKNGRAIKMIGIKTFECNFNPEKRWYNPHFHLIVPDWETAALIKAEWLKLWTRRYAEEWSQKIKPIPDIEKKLVELIKYCSKIFTEKPSDKKLNRDVDPKIYVAALYNILKVMEKHRVFDRFGFPNKKQFEETEAIYTPTVEYMDWVFDPQTADYINDTQEEPMIGHNKDPELEYLLEHCVDLELD